jgi:hypothetical protein
VALEVIVLHHCHITSFSVSPVSSMSFVDLYGVDCYHSLIPLSSLISLYSHCCCERELRLLNLKPTVLLTQNDSYVYMSLCLNPLPPLPQVCVMESTVRLLLEST